MLLGSGEGLEMTDTGAGFVSELIRAANEIVRLTKPEQARLLERAANTLRDYHHQISISGTPANNEDLYIVAHQWSQMAKRIDLFTAVEVSATLIEAAGTIKAVRVLLDEK
jgi:hypothetical protein